MDDRYLESITMSGLLKYVNKKDHARACDELNMAPHHYASQQLIYSQGDRVGRAGIVHQGLIKGEKLHIEGTTHLAYAYMQGELFAFEGAVSGKKTSPLDFTAESDTTVLFFDVANIFTGSFERPLIIGLMELLANDNIKKLYRIETLSQRGLRSRILTYFNIMAAKNDGEQFHLNMSRQQLAQYLCVNRTALSFELNQMKREGIIDFDRRRIRILSK